MLLAGLNIERFDNFPDILKKNQITCSSMRTNYRFWTSEQFATLLNILKAKELCCVNVITKFEALIHSKTLVSCHC